MLNRFERAFALSTSRETTVYHWDGESLHTCGSVTGPVSHYALDIERDRMAVGHEYAITIWRGVFQSEPQVERVVVLSNVGFFGVSSLAMKDGVLFAARSRDPRMVSLDLEQPSSEWQPISTPEGLSYATATLVLRNDTLLALDVIGHTPQWRVYECSHPREEPPTLIRIHPVQGQLGFDACRPAVAQSDRAFVAVTHEYGGHTHFVSLTVFDRVTLDRLFTVECPELYTRELTKDPDPFYVHCDAWEEQVLICESSRGIGVIRSDTLVALAQYADENGRLDPARLHAAARWISVAEKTIEAAYLCGSAHVAAHWREDPSREREFVLHDLTEGLERAPTRSET